MTKTITNVVRYALVSLFSFLFISSAQADELKMALFNYCNTGYEVVGWHSCQQEGGGALNTETDNGVSVGGATIGGNFKRSFSKLVGTDLPTFATADMQTNLGIEVPYNAYISGVANGAKTDGTITISGLNAESSYVIYAGCGHDNGNIGKSSCGFKVPSNGCAEVDSLDYVVTVASGWGRSGSSTVVADSFTSFDFGESICAGADGLALIRMKGIVPKSGGTIDLVLTGERAGINFIAIKELPPPVLPETTITAEAVKVSDINNASEFTGCTSADKVIVNLTAAKTLEFDTAFAFGQAKIVYDGALKLLGEVAPADLAKFDFKGVTSLDYAWLPVGTGMAINFNEGQGKLGDTDEALIPGLTIYGNTWNNVGTSGSLDAKMFGSDGSTVLADTIPVSYNGGSYQWTNATTPYLKGYLDDSNISFITTVPFSYYDVYIICATDTANAKFSYKTINGVNYSANDNGEAVAGSTAAWGASQQSTPILGKNVMRLSGLTTQKFEITNSPKGDGRGCIAAIVIVKVAPPSPAVTATISANTTWSALWAGGTAPAANTPVELTFVGSATLTLDTEVVAKSIKLIGDTTEQVVGIAGTATNINAFLGKVTATADFAGKFDYRFDVASGLTADSALLNMIKSAGSDKIFTFIGSGENGVTFGSSSSTWNGTLNSHIVLNGGKHAIYWSNGNALFGAGASVDNPTLLLEKNAILDFYGHDITGWSAYADDDNARLAGVIRINNGSTLNMHRQGDGTVYYNQTFCIEGGAKITTDINGTDARMGGAKIVVPAQDAVGAPAEIVCLSTGSGSLFFGKDVPKGAEFSIGANAKLKITGAVESLNSGNNRVSGGGDYPINKTGVGILEVTGNILAPVNVNGGSIALGGTAKSITFADDAVLTSLNTISLKDFSVAEGKTLTLDATAGDIAITKAPTNNGTIKIVGGNVAFMPETNVGTIIEEGGKAVYGYIVNINDCGKFTIPEGKTAETIRLFDAAGTAIPFTDNKDGTVSYEWVVTGGVCWWDYEFEGNGNNDGTDGTALSWDNDRPRKGAEFTEDGELYVSSSPWRGGVNWPAKATFVMYGTMVGSDKTYQIGFGSTYQGQVPYNTIFLATDTISENTVNLCICQAKDAPTVLCQMTVPNAQTAKHLYAFTLKTVENKTVVDIYLDGELLQSYPFDSQIVLGTGFQVGSGHGGVCAGYNKTVAADEAVLDFLRVYTEEFTSEAHTKYAVKYPYVSPNGSYQRTVTADGDWSATEVWTKEGTEPAELADVPAANATVKLAIDNDATTTIAINLADDVSYEAIQINGDDVKFVLAEGDGFGGVAKSSGRVTANANVTFAYDAFSMAGAPLTVKAGKIVTFDLSMVDMTQFFSTQTYDLTGYLTLEEGADVTFIVPEELHGREASAAIDPVTKHYVLTVTPPNYPFTYKDGAWTWGTQTVDETIMNANPTIERVIKSDLEMALGSYNYTVDEGATLKPLDQDAPCTITVNDGGTLDLNGTKSSAAANTYAVVMNGGTLANSSDELSVIKSLTLDGDAAIALTAGSIAIQSAQGGWAATTLALGENTLTITKTGDTAARLELVETTVTGTGTIDVQSGTLWIQENDNFGQATVKLGEAGVFAVREGRTATISNIEGADGALIDNAGTITDFTLTGTITLAGAGTFGAITLDEAALDLAEVRGLTIDGEGSVKATITAAEMAEGIVCVFTKAEDATISSVTLVDEVGEELSGYTADYDEEGNYIAYFTVSVAIPELTGADVVVTVEGVEEPISVVGGYAAIPYGANMTVTYTAQDGYLFKDESDELELTFPDVTEDPDVAKSIEGEEVVEISAEIEGWPYAMVQHALEDAAEAESAMTVVLLRDVEESVAFEMIAKNVILDLNGYALVGNISATAPEKSTLVFTIKNPAEEGYQGGAVIGDITMTNGKLTISRNSTLDTYVVGSITLNDVADASIQGTVYQDDSNKAAITVNGESSLLKITNVANISAAGTAIDAKAGTVKILSNSSASTSYIGGTIVAAEGVNLSVTGGTFTFDPSDIVSDGYVAVEQETDPVTWKVVKITLPTASVTEITAEGYETAVEFTAGEIGGDYYNNWTAEFVLTSDVAIGADEIKLGGQYDAYSTEWIDINFPGCEAGESISVLGLVGYNDITVETVFDTIQSFKCGVKNIGLKNDATFTLKLVITDGETTKEICSIDGLEVKAAGGGKIVPEEQGTVEVTGTGEDAVAVITPKEGVTKLDISMPDGFAGKYEVPSSITQITGVEINQLIIKSNGFDIAPACKIDDGGNIVLDATKSVTVGDETIPVTPTLTASDDEVKPLVVSDDETAVGVKAIPGLTYTLVRSTALGGEETSVASDTATTARLTLADTFEGGKPTSAFYVIKVTK